MMELNQCPVIFLSFVEIKIRLFKGIFELMGRIREEYERYYISVIGSTVIGRSERKI